MKFRYTIPALLLAASLAFAQSTTPQTPPAGSDAQTGAGAAQGPMQPQRRGPRGMGMQQMHGQHLQEMKDQLTKMHQLLEQMKAGVAKMQPSEQPAMQANVDMWQIVVDHFDQMVQHMSERGPGMGRGMRRGMGAGAGTGSGLPSSTGPTQPSTPPSEPPK